MTDKRKVNGAERVAADDLDDRSLKRRKMPNDTSAPTKGETPETTKLEGLKALDHVKTITDKSGRVIHTDFRSLPNKKKFPDYYTFTRLPIALDTLEAKLKRHEFSNLTAFESWFKRMVLNAKEYNEKGSQIYDDAERLRKGFSNYMTKVNPAYKVHGFVVTPVALPEEQRVDDEVEHDIEEPATAKRGKGRGTKAIAKSPPPPAWKVAKYPGKGFSGLTFQQAQEKVVEDMILFNDDPKNVITTFEDFVELPPKDLKDYYAVIQDPRSLRTLWEQVQGIDHGKKSVPSSLSKFGNWEEFEAEASIIWANACHYNEDDSEIFNLAKELEIFFYRELELAKKAVPGPPGPKKIMLKIGGSKAPQPQPPQNPRITLKLPGQKGSPAPSPAAQSNGANGNGPAANGTGRRNPFGGSASATVEAPSLDQLQRARSMSGSVASPTVPNAAAVKHEDGRRNSPALAPNPNYRATSQTVSTPGLNAAGMPPPSTPGLTQSFSQSGGFTQSFNHQPQYPISNSAFESKWRQPGKDASDAMMTNLSLSTHPGLNIPNHLQMNLPPSDTMTHQSVTINLPPTHYFLQIKPTIALNLLERQHKLFITLNHQRLHAMPLIPGHPLDPRHPLFEGRLLPGVNRLEIELIASLPKGVPKPPNGPDTELEKITVFANLLKAA